MIKRQMVSVRLDGGDVQAKREELLEYFHQSFELFESLFDLLKSDDVFYRQSEPTRHPMIFYFGHTAVFYINKLLLANGLKERIHPGFESLFAVGVDEMLWDEESGRFEWPEVDAVRAYRRQVRETVDHFIRTFPMILPVSREDPFWALWMGIEHERIHIETSSVLHRQMPLEFVRPHDAFPLCPKFADAPENTLIPVIGGEVTLGKGESDQGLYGWDNEYGTQSVTLSPFEASLYLVSNGEFLAFVRDGGYESHEWWDEEGLKYLSIRHAKAPPFWVAREDGTFRYRSLAEEIEMPLNWPVEVNALEAEAFCRWKSAKEGKLYRLPGETEWAVMAQTDGVELNGIFDDQHANLNFARYASSVPVDTFRHGSLYDVAGNVWQWTRTPIAGFEGFAPHPWYDDFSLPTFDGKHNLLKGGSWASTGNEIVATSRYAFRRHFIQHAGFRYVVGEARREGNVTSVIKEADVSAICRFQYETHGKLFREILERFEGYFGREGRVLELGCGTGRLSFGLSNWFEAVDGVDFSARMIRVGAALLQEGSVTYQADNEESSVHLRSLDALHAAERVNFYQGDISNLKPHFTGYDTIVINNTLENLRYREHLSSLAQRLVPGGRMVVISADAAHFEEGEDFETVGVERVGETGVWIGRKTGG